MVQRSRYSSFKWKDKNSGGWSSKSAETALFISELIHYVHDIAGRQTTEKRHRRRFSLKQSKVNNSDGGSGHDFQSCSFPES